MAETTALMTWNQATGRWFKKENGKQYAISAGKLKKLYPTLCKGATEAGTMKAANAWWIARLASLATSHPSHADYIRLIASHRELAEAARSTGGDGSLDDSIANGLQAELDSGSLRTLDRWERDPLAGVSEIGKAVWSERKRTAKGKTLAVTIGSAFEKYLAEKRAAIANEPWKAGNIANVCHYVTKFVNWLPVDDPNQIKALTLTDYRTWVLSNKEWKQRTKRDIVGTAKSFIVWMYKVEIMDALPRNIEDFKIVVSDDSMTVPFTDDELTNLLAECDSKQKLWVLLALNVGMTQEDISELRHHEVDWVHGRIVRQRSKTGRRNRDIVQTIKANKSIPTVNTKLWPETFRLLKEQRSNHPQLVLVSAKGNPLNVREEKTTGKHKAKRNDVIGRNFNRLCDRLGIEKSFSGLKKNAASKLYNHDSFSQFAQLLLGHSAKTIAEKFYVTPSTATYDDAIAWLGSQYGF